MKKIVHSCLRKVELCFQKRGMEKYFVKGKKKGDFVLKPVISNGKNKGQSMASKLQKVCGRGTLRKELGIWSGFSKVGLYLIR